MIRWLALLVLILGITGCGRRPAVICYTANWCVPCQQQKQGIEALRSVADVQIVDCSNGLPKGVPQVPYYTVWSPERRLLGCVTHVRDVRRFVQP